MLINATQAEELRVALVDGDWLYDIDIETPGKEQKEANIYKSIVTRVEPSLEAVFVDYGAERHGFLPFREISCEYRHESFNNSNCINNSYPLYVGQEIIIQIERGERGNKGAALTTYISLPGCYIVLMPNNPRAGGISRRIEGDERVELREALSTLNIPEEMGIIARTICVGRSVEELQWDLNVLLTQWHAIKKAAEEKPASFLVFQESNVIVRAIRDHLKPDVLEILIDNPDVYRVVRSHIQMMRPDFISKVKYYDDIIPLFSCFQIEEQIELAFQRKIILPSGAVIVFDYTEALTSVDINSAKATKGCDIEETALQTNLDAIVEIARQLRFRDLGGLIVIDFIDMTAIQNQREIEEQLHIALSKDRARVQISKISRFGLLEMSRQRLRTALNESRDITCPRCLGLGQIRNVEAHSLNVLRVIEESANKENIAEVWVELPIKVATYLINEKRFSLDGIEHRQHVRIILLPNEGLVTPAFRIQCVRLDEEIVQNLNEITTYQLSTKPVKNQLVQKCDQIILEQPAVQRVVPVVSVPLQEINVLPKENVDIFRVFWSTMMGYTEFNVIVDLETNVAIRKMDNYQQEQQPSYFEKNEVFCL